MMKNYLLEAGMDNIRNAGFMEYGSALENSALFNFDGSVGPGMSFMTASIYA